ncbi:uncharacterized protein APUU_50643S [Aspergillus puulaauensis]|uniref:Uncharacterized protein n=1 Tax=Aspergillus puulaauensis TaxID=1220207 RepID=A0A7R8APF8_9EURO|nr:uncharacterized protein APUU_50643S [Aspergillus puulaauensis]BCS25932.1 hypothetical protein APUU_50643S [Aspergillus puulaauensis]
MIAQQPRSFLKLFSAPNWDSDLTSTKGPARPSEPPPKRASTMARFRTHQHKKNARSLASEGPWKVDTPFGPPEISHIHVPGGIRRIRNTFAKLTPSARAERQLLRQKNLYKSPLTERNVDTFVTHQEFAEACYPNRHSNEVQVVAWLDRLY